MDVVHSLQKVNMAAEPPRRSKNLSRALVMGPEASRLCRRARGMVHAGAVIGVRQDAVLTSVYVRQGTGWSMVLSRPSLTGNACFRVSFRVPLR